MKSRKKFNKLLITSFISACLTLPFSANANNCDISFQYGVIIDPDHVRFLEHDMTYVQINNENQLFVHGKEVKLTPQQTQLVTQYTTGIRQQVPQIVEIAIEGVDIGLKAVNQVIAGVTGENSASHQKIQKHFDELQWRLRKRFNHSDQNYYIAPQDFDDFEDIFAGQFEQEIESIVTESIGTILMAVGEAMNNQENSSSENRDDNFSDRMETMGDELELEISSKVTTLESKTAMFCAKLRELDDIETQLNQQISALKSFSLIN